MRFARLIAILLIFAMTPAASELGEWAAHFIVHGDFAHNAHDGALEAHEDGAPGSDEHGCSPIFHLCACHASPLFTIPIAQQLAPPASTNALDLAGVEHDGRGRDPPPIRPPISLT